MPPPLPQSRDDFKFAIICGLIAEYDAVLGVLDLLWDEGSDLGKANNDTNTYKVGMIGKHNVVVVKVPDMGKIAAASVTANFKTSYPEVKLGLVVGICGGVPIIPTDEGPADVIIGDIMISTGVIQYDYGQQHTNEVSMKDTLEDNLGRPNPEIRAFLETIKSQQDRKDLKQNTNRHLAKLLSDFEKKNYTGWKYPGVAKDVLYPPTYRHKHHEPGACPICTLCHNDNDKICKDALKLPCADVKCDITQQVDRKRLREFKEDVANEGSEESSASKEHPLEEGKLNRLIRPRFEIYFGRIASGDLVMKSSRHRDNIASDHKVIAFEMEGAGIWDNFPTIIIKGVCDYADSHKGHEFRKFSAASAAACMKAILNMWWATDKALHQDGLSITANFIRAQTASFQAGDPFRRLPEHASRQDTTVPSPSTEHAISTQVEHAETLLKRRKNETMVEDLTTSRKKLLQALDDPSSRALHLRIYRALMIIELEWSFYKGLEGPEERMGHVKTAQEYGIKASNLLSPTAAATVLVQLRLDQAFLRGRKAELDLNGEVKKGTVSSLKKDVIKNIDKALRDLKSEDENKFEKTLDYALDWREYLMNASF